MIWNFTSTNFSRFLIWVLCFGAEGTMKLFKRILILFYPNFSGFKCSLLYIFLAHTPNPYYVSIFCLQCQRFFFLTITLFLRTSECLCILGTSTSYSSKRWSDFSLYLFCSWLLFLRFFVRWGVCLEILYILLFGPPTEGGLGPFF